MRKLTFDEISNWEEFENLAAACFRIHPLTQSKRLIKVEVTKGGKGSDGGRDLLVKLTMNDLVETYERKWVIQCKFYNRDLKKSDLADVNIPTLIHQYGADGYLLICKKNVGNTFAAMFEDLNRNCKFGYRYEIWTGDELKAKTLVEELLEVQRQFFPEFFFAQQQSKFQSI